MAAALFVFPKFPVSGKGSLQFCSFSRGEEVFSNEGDAIMERCPDMGTLYAELSVYVHAYLDGLLMLLSIAASGIHIFHTAVWTRQDGYFPV